MAERPPGIWWLLPILLLATLAAYYPAWHGGILWDDDKHMTREALRSAGGLWRIWFEPGATQQYYPITHSAFWLEYRLWGGETLGYHFANIALHTTSAYLVAVILRRLAVPGAVLAAVIFALHPVHVESVAWISELKNVLSGVFFLAAVLAYLRFDDRRQGRSYASSFGLFLLALLSKSVTAVLPGALLVIVWWRRGTIERRRDVWPLVPFFAAGAAAGLVTAWLERTMIGAQGAGFGFSLAERCLIAGRVIWFYFGKLLWPSNLIFNYPRWAISGDVWWQYLYPLAMVGAAGGLFLLRRRTRAPLAAMLLFCGLLFPVLGFVNVYPFRFSFVADHFAYLASIPIIALIAGGVSVTATRWRVSREAATVAVLALGVTLGLLTFRQSRHYVSAEALYLDILDHNPSSWLAYGNLGVLEMDSAPAQALAHLDRAIALSPDAAETHNDRGTVLQRMGRVEEAVRDYREAVRLVPTFATAHSNLANALLALGHPEEAIATGREAFRLQPDLVEAHYTVALALQSLGRTEAVDHFNAVLKLRPGFAEAHNQLAIVLQAMGRRDEALGHLREAVRLEPGDAGAHENLGRLLQEMGRNDEAVRQHETALSLAPDSPVAHNNLGVALRKSGRMDEALVHFETAVRLQPDYADAQFNLATTLQTLGRVQESVPHYLEVLRHDPSDIAAHTNLGAAFEALGRRAEAAAQYREASRLKGKS